ncbi:hypothetical protein IFM89_028019, partial [Coptis chinensis]
DFLGAAIVGGSEETGLITGETFGAGETTFCGGVGIGVKAFGGEALGVEASGGEATLGGGVEMGVNERGDALGGSDVAATGEEKGDESGVCKDFGAGDGDCAMPKSEIVSNKIAAKAAMRYILCCCENAYSANEIKLLRHISESPKPINMEGANQLPLLLHRGDHEDISRQPLKHGGSSFNASPIGDGDIEPVKNVNDFFREFAVESKKLWFLAGPAIFTSVSRYTLGAVTQAFAGQVGTLELAAVSIENSVIAGFSLGVMRTWVILDVTALPLVFLYIFATPILKLIGQEENIAETAGKLAIWMIPQLFAYAVNIPQAKFLQAQSKMLVMSLIAFAALVFRTFFSWLFMLKLGWGLAGAAVVLNASWWFIDIAQFLYIISGTCGCAWTGFSMKAFENLWGFVRLSIASAVMLW